MRIVFNLMGHYNPSSGGTHVMITQMKDLHEAGHEVYVYVYWEEEQQSIINIIPPEFKLLKLEELNSDDIVIVAEEFVWVAHDLLLEKNIPYVIFNQGIYASFYSYNPYNIHKKTYEKALGILVNSYHTAIGIEKLFKIPKDKIYTYRIGIDEKLYYPENKDNTACYLSFKNQQFSRFIDVYFRGNYPEWNLIKIDKLPKEETAAIFRKSKLFFSFGGPEGFGLPPLEAAFCGCKVIGFDGYAGSEYFKEPLFTTIKFQDHLEFLDKIQEKIKNIDIWTAYDYEYLSYLKYFYNKDKAKNSIIEFINQIVPKKEKYPQFKLST
jgi:glycosyltransferase involved in cell wall biosynthesis